ncbi:hypothetical protein [Streptomyces albidoflavus]|uniref:hypothetical protein n=1 Tax=Streptomyces albidoflavus TaxID=1886 RepID=UPI00332B7C2C
MTDPRRTAADVLELPGVRALLEDAAGRPAQFLAVAEEDPGPTGWHFYVLSVADSSLALSYPMTDWTIWRPASAGHRLIERGYIVSPPAHFEDDRGAGWASLPGGRWSAPLHPVADFVSGAPAPDDPQWTGTTITEDDGQEDGGPRAEPCSLDVLPTDYRAALPAGSSAARCTGCGDVRVTRHGVPFDAWKNHWPDECEAIQADDES